MRYLLLVVLAITLWGKVIEARYNVSYGLFGKVAQSVARLEQNESSYKIKIIAEATGFAKVLTGNRKEIYISEGKVVNGRLVPLHFIKIRSKRGKVSKKVFDFDHEHKKVYVHKEITYGNERSTSKPSLYSYYAKDDLLTLYFNIIDEIRKKEGAMVFYAVGGDRKSGRVDIVIPNGPEKEKLKKLLKSDGFYLIAIIHQKIFASKDGKLYIVVDEDGFAKKALLKDVILFGDIVGKLVQKRVSE